MQRTKANNQDISARKEIIQNALRSKLGLREGEPLVGGRYNSEARVIEVTQTLNVVGQRSWADSAGATQTSDLVAVIASANPICPLMALYMGGESGTSGNNRLDMGQLVGDGVDSAPNAAFANTTNDNLVGTVVEKVGEDDNVKKFVFPRVKSSGCLGGCVDVTSYSNLTNTEGQLTTFEIDNRGLWTFTDGGFDDYILGLVTDSNAQRLDSYQIVPLLALNAATGTGAGCFPMIPNSDTPEKNMMTNHSYAWYGSNSSWPAADPAYLAPIAVAATALNPIGNTSMGPSFQNTHGGYGHLGNAASRQGFADPNYDVRLFDCRSLSSNAKLTFTHKSSFVVEPYMSQLASFPSSAPKTRASEKAERAVNQVARELAKRSSSKSELSRLIQGATHVVDTLIKGGDGHFDIGDASRLVSGLGTFGYGAMTGNPVALAGGLSTLTRPMLTM